MDSTRRRATKKTGKTRVKATRVVEWDRLPAITLATILKVHRTTPGKWTERGCPRNRDGTFCIADVVNWRLEEAGIRVEGVENRDESMGRWRSAKAGIAEIELAKLDGSIIPTKVARSAIGKLINDARTIWQGLPTSISMMIADPELKGFVKSECEQTIKSGLKALERAASEINKTAKQESKEWNPTPKP